MSTTPQRCDFRWTPPPINGVCYPEMQCTHRGDVEHPHAWSSYEETLWREHEEREHA